MSKFNYVKAIRMMRMPATTKLVAMTLATYADYETGECYPTIDTLMEDTQLSNRAVCQHIKHIESLGVLVVDRSNGRRSFYKFIAENLTKAVTQSHQLPKVTSDFDDIQPVTITTEPVTLTQKAVTQGHTNYHKQPIEQPKELPSISAQEKPKVETKPKSEPKPKAKNTSLPKNFGISEAVKKWAEGKDFGDLEQHLEYFINKALAKNYQYADWDRAFMGAIRDDWAKLNAKPIAQYPVTQKTPYQSAAERTAAEQQRWADFLNGSPDERDVTPKKSYLISEVGHA